MSKIFSGYLLILTVYCLFCYLHVVFMTLLMQTSNGQSRLVFCQDTMQKIGVIFLIFQIFNEKINK